MPSEAPLGRNQTIDSLPDELLSEIFRFVQPDSDDDCFRRERQWFRVLWVSRRWSGVGRAAASLWCNITIERTLKRSLITASLEYSKNALLTIKFEVGGHLAEVLPLLFPHIHRIRSLQIEPDTTQYDISLAAFLSHPFPSMETFEERSLPIHDPLIWQPDASSYPRLRNLILEGTVSIKVAPTAVFPALRKLLLS